MSENSQTKSLEVSLKQARGAVEKKHRVSNGKDTSLEKETSELLPQLLNRIKAQETLVSLLIIITFVDTLSFLMRLL